MICDRLHAKWLTYSRLMILLYSLIARRRVGPQTNVTNDSVYSLVHLLDTNLNLK